MAIFLRLLGGMALGFICMLFYPAFTLGWWLAVAAGNVICIALDIRFGRYFK